jgi:hypothetical protein
VVRTLKIYSLSNVQELNMSFEEQSLIILIKSKLPVSIFIAHACVLSKKSLLNAGSHKFSHFLKPGTSGSCVILATWEAKIGRIMVRSQPG